MEQPRQSAESPGKPINLSLPLPLPISNQMVSIQTAPNSPTNLSVTPPNGLNQPPQSGSDSSENLQAIPSHEPTEQLDPDHTELESLFSDRIQTDPEFEAGASETQTMNNEYTNRKTSLRSLQNLIDDIKKVNDDKTYSGIKAPQRTNNFKTPKKWPKEISEIPKTDEKELFRIKKRPLSSNERLNDTRGLEESSRMEKKVIKTAVKDLELNFRSADMLAGEGDGLFDEESEREVHSCKNSRETGPIRYSKMSEEDAAAMFDIRRKELLTFLKKLGSSSAMTKKKLSARKPGQSFDVKKHLLENDQRMKLMKGSLSPTTFIIYNNATESIWNNSNPARLTTPFKDSGKRHMGSFKGNSESISDAKGVSVRKEKEEEKLRVQRNLEASFNKIAQDLESLDKKGVKKAKASERIGTSLDEKKDVFENIKIDLKKAASNKQAKKAESSEKPENKQTLIENLLHKRLSSGATVTTAATNNENQAPVVKPSGNKKLIEQMRKKNQAVLGDIDEIDMQIQRMEAEKNQTHRGKKQGAVSIVGKKLEKFEDFEEEKYDDEEGSSYAALKKKSKARPRSLAFLNPVADAMKKKEPVIEEKNVQTKGKQNNKMQQQETGRSVQWDDEQQRKILGRKEEQQRQQPQSISGKSSLKINEKGQLKKTSDQNHHHVSSKSTMHEVNVNLNTLNELKKSFNLNDKKPNTAVKNVPALDKKKMTQRLPIKPTLEIEKNKSTLNTVPTLQSTRYPSLNNSTSPELFLISKSSNFSNESLRSKIQGSKLQLDSSKTEGDKRSAKIKQKKSFELEENLSAKQEQPGVYNRHSVANIQEHPKSPKISFFDEVKKILKEGLKEEKKMIGNFQDKNKMTEKNKVVKDEGSGLKRAIPNKPKFDFSPNLDIRAKILMEPRPIEEDTKVLKLHHGGGSNSSLKKRDSKGNH